MNESPIGNVLDRIAQENIRNEKIRRAAQNVLDAFEGYVHTNLQQRVLEDLKNALERVAQEHEIK